MDINLIIDTIFYSLMAVMISYNLIGLGAILLHGVRVQIAKAEIGVRHDPIDAIQHVDYFPDVTETSSLPEWEPDMRLFSYLLCQTLIQLEEDQMLKAYTVENEESAFIISHILGCYSYYVKGNNKSQLEDMKTIEGSLQGYPPQYLEKYYQTLLDLSSLTKQQLEKKASSKLNLQSNSLKKLRKFQILHLLCNQ